MKRNHTLLMLGQLKIYVCLCLCISLCSCSACSDYFNKKESDSLLYLKGEFDQIPALPESLQQRPTQSREKGWTGLVVSNYISNLSSDEIKAHYQTELLQKGWKFCRVEKVIYRGYDYGGQHVFYRKETYIADLQLAGKQEREFGWTYAFSMSWGLFDDFECS